MRLPYGIIIMGYGATFPGLETRLNFVAIIALGGLLAFCVKRDPRYATIDTVYGCVKKLSSLTRLGLARMHITP
jgi:hypothetical protein